MKFILRIMPVILTVGLLINPLNAYSMDDDTIESPEIVVNELAGKVTSIDLAGKQIIIEHQAADEDVATSAILTLSENLSVFNNDEVVDVSVITEGINVSVTYLIDENGNKVVEAIFIEE